MLQILDEGHRGKPVVSCHIPVREVVALCQVLGIVHPLAVSPVSQGRVSLTASSYSSYNFTMTILMPYFAGLFEMYIWKGKWLQKASICWSTVRNSCRVQWCCRPQWKYATSWDKLVSFFLLFFGTDIIKLYVVEKESKMPLRHSCPEEISTKCKAPDILSGEVVVSPAAKYEYS